MTTSAAMRLTEVDPSVTTLAIFQKNAVPDESTTLAFFARTLARHLDVGNVEDAEAVIRLIRATVRAEAHAAATP